MRAIIQSAYGPADKVWALGEVATPTPGDDEVLIRVMASSMHADVWHTVEGVPYIMRLMGSGLRKPKRMIPGTDVAGIVEAAGKNVTRLQCGDAVFGETVKFGWLNGGAYADYVVVREEYLVHKPANITFEQAAGVPAPGIIALSNIGLHDKPGQNVLINGAGGAMGLLAIQILKAQGARVTAVDCAEKLPIMRLQGADRVIDYALENYLSGSERFDFILDVATILRASQYKHVLTETGYYRPIGHAHYGHAPRFNGRMLGSMPYFIGFLLGMMLRSKQRSQFKMLTKLAIMNRLKLLIEAGKLTPVVAKTYPLEAVCEAMHDMQSGRMLGRMIIVP
jgi:NADPH:quinone reductase-like Zn-dependent oxidoreductase